MEIIKNFTSLKQSKKLAEFLPLESADHFHIIGHLHTDGPRYEVIRSKNEVSDHDSYWPCWSLAALLSVLPSRLFDATPKRKELYLLPDLDKSYCFYRQFAVKTKGKIYLLTEGDCLVDACYEMILKLKENNLL